MSTARTSESVFGCIEPKNTKAVFDCVRSFALNRFARSRDRVVFVEVGANDGRRADPLFPHIMDGGWTGLLIEPLPEAFEALRQSYSGVKGLLFERVAVSDKAGQTKFFAVKGERSAMSSLSREVIMRHAATRPDLPEQIYEIEVPTCRLDELLDRHGFETLDVLAVDTEGHDDTVLSTIEIETWAPAVVLFEHVHLSRDGSQALKRRLEALPYTLIWDRHDCMAIRDGALEPDVIGLMKGVVEAAKTR
jgi:FkbM family methyltransferase